jgi:hypothetical protein
MGIGGQTGVGVDYGMWLPPRPLPGEGALNGKYDTDTSDLTGDDVTSTESHSLKASSSSRQLMTDVNSDVDVSTSVENRRHPESVHSVSEPQRTS